MSRVNIIINLRVPGIHCWKDCPYQDVAFLRSLHRHEFHICAKKAVSHTDRDIEIIRFKRDMEQYFRDTFEWHGTAYMFGLMSCEQLAERLTKHFNLAYCSVLEDGENGAEIITE